MRLDNGVVLGTLRIGEVTRLEGLRRLTGTPTPRPESRWQKFWREFVARLTRQTA